MVGYQLIAAGVTAVLAFLLWGPLGILTGLLTLNAARLAARPPVAARTDFSRLRVGGQLSSGKNDLSWTDVEDVSVDGQRITFDRGATADDGPVVLSLSLLGAQATEFVRDVHERLNTANGYRRFDPDA